MDTIYDEGEDRVLGWFGVCMGEMSGLSLVGSVLYSIFELKKRVLEITLQGMFLSIFKVFHNIQWRPTVWDHNENHSNH